MGQVILDEADGLGQGQHSPNQAIQPEVNLVEPVFALHFAQIRFRLVSRGYRWALREVASLRRKPQSDSQTAQACVSIVTHKYKYSTSHLAQLPLSAVRSCPALRTQLTLQVQCILQPVKGSRGTIAALSKPTSEGGWIDQ